MSKRYGRQQKRKARAEIEALKKSLKRTEWITSCVRKDLEVAERVVDVVRRVNPNSAALKKATVIGEQVWWVNVEPRNMNVLLVGETPASVVDIRRINLYQLESELCESDIFTDAVHFNVRLRSEYSGKKLEYGYRASLEGIKRQGVEGMAREIAVQMERDISELS